MTTSDFYFESKQDALNTFIETAKEYFEEVKKVCIRKEKKLGQNGIRNSDWIELGRRILFDGQNPEKLAQNYVKHVLPHEKVITERNDKFFLENSHIYLNIDPKYISFFKELWINNDGHGFSKNEREISFEYFDIMIQAVKAWHNWNKSNPK